MNCGSCKFLDLSGKKCISVPEPAKNQMMPPAPIFMNDIIQRYGNWNINILQDLKNGRFELVKGKIEDMKKKGISYVDIINDLLK